MKQRQPNGSDLNVLHFHHTYWALLNTQLISFTWRLIISRKATQAEASKFGKSVSLALTAILVYFQAVCENWEASVKISLRKTNTSVQNRLSVLAEQGGMRWAELLSDYCSLLSPLTEPYTDLRCEETRFQPRLTWVFYILSQQQRPL